MDGVNWRQVGAAGIGVAMLGVIGFVGRAQRSPSPSVKPVRELHAPEPTAGSVVIDLRGAVKNPGVYELERGARMRALLQKCGGLTAMADTDRVNWAGTLKDGSMVTVPERASTDSAKPHPESLGVAATNPRRSPSPADGRAESITNPVPEALTTQNRNQRQAKNDETEPILGTRATKKSSQSPRATLPAVNLNSAGRDDIAALPGVSYELADSIIRLRTRLTKFETLSDLMLVDGMTERIAKNLVSKVVL